MVRLRKLTDPLGRHAAGRRVFPARPAHGATPPVRPNGTEWCAGLGGTANVSTPFVAFAEHRRHQAGHPGSPSRVVRPRPIRGGRGGPDARMWRPSSGRWRGGRRGRPAGWAAASAPMAVRAFAGEVGLRLDRPGSQDDRCGRRRSQRVGDIIAAQATRVQTDRRCSSPAAAGQGSPRGASRWPTT